MANVNKVTTSNVKLDEREVHEAVSAFVLKNKTAYGLVGKWKLDGSTQSRDPESGTITIEVNLVKE